MSEKIIPLSACTVLCLYDLLLDLSGGGEGGCCRVGTEVFCQPNLRNNIGQKTGRATLSNCCPQLFDCQYDTYLSPRGKVAPSDIIPDQMINVKFAD